MIKNCAHNGLDLIDRIKGHICFGGLLSFSYSSGNIEQNR